MSIKNLNHQLFDNILLLYILIDYEFEFNSFCEV